MKSLAACVAVTCFLCPASEQVEAASAPGLESAFAQALAGGQFAQATARCGKSSPARLLQPVILMSVLCLLTKAARLQNLFRMTMREQ
jgi:hypothetical protein